MWKVSAAPTLLQTTIVIYTACTETIRRWLSYKLMFPVAGTHFSEEKIYLRNLFQHFERLICVLWLPHWSLFQGARTAASINCRIMLPLIYSTDWFLFRGPFFAVKFCWRILKLLCLKFCVETSMEFYFPRISPYVASALSLLHI